MCNTTFYMKLIVFIVLIIRVSAIQGPRIAHCISGQLRSALQTHNSHANVLVRHFGRHPNETRANADVFVYLDIFPHTTPPIGIYSWINTLSPVAWMIMNETYRDGNDIVPENNCTFHHQRTRITEPRITIRC